MEINTAKLGLFARTVGVPSQGGSRLVRLVQTGHTCSVTGDGRKRVLVVEDDPEIRKLLMRVWDGGRDLVSGVVLLV